MKKILYSAFLSLLVAIVICFTVSTEPVHNEVLTEYQYLEEAQPKASVAEARKRAIASGKPLLVVFGANWCHDSRGLSSKFSNPEMHKLLADKFVIQFVDVGYYQDRRDITTELGYPGYFATPSVFLIRDPENPSPDLDTLTLYQSADSVPLNDYISHFASRDTVLANTTPFFPNSPSGNALKTYSQNVTDRLQAGFNELGPMLKEEQEGTLKDKARIDALWTDVKTFRVNVQNQLHTLSDDANISPEHALTLHKFEAQSWEK